MVTDVKNSTNLVTFGLFSLLAGGKIKSENNVILQMCTNYYDHCMYVWVIMVADGQNSIILVTFWPFYHLAP